MEDASKALLIAAGMFFAILILTALVMLYNQVSSFYTFKHDENVIEQTQKFNAKFANYNRKDIRGSDLISLMNMIIDYNESQIYKENRSDDKILVNINVGNTTILKEFMFKEIENKNDYNINKKIKSNITNIKNIENESKSDWGRDNDLIAIAGTPRYLCDDLRTKVSVTNPTEAQLQQLYLKISSIILSDNAEEKIEYKSLRLDRANIIEDILGITLALDSNGIGDATKIKDIKNIVNQYYQYVKFKSAMFDCTGVTYDPETNRIIRMDFDLQIKNGKPVFD